MDPVTIIFAVGLLVASYALTSLTARKPPNAKPAALEDFDFPQIDDGRREGDAQRFEVRDLVHHGGHVQQRL